jgi:TolA-binding protein
MLCRQRICAAVLTLLGLTAVVLAQTRTPPAPIGKPPGSTPASDVEMVERLLASRKEYQASLETLRKHYVAVGDAKRAHWAEEELRHFHHTSKHAFRLDLEVPPPTLQAAYNIPEANELYRRAMTYKDKGWGDEYVYNQRRAEILLQQLLTNYPQSDKIGDAAFQLGDIYEGKTNQHYERAAAYFERCYQWKSGLGNEARLRAARIYDKQLSERGKAQELYTDVTTHDTDQKRIQEAQKRLAELTGKK